MLKKIIRYMSAAIKSDKKLFHIKRIVSSWYYVLVNINNLRHCFILTKYYSSEQYKLNNWTMAQSRRYGKDFEEVFFKDSFIYDFDKLLTGFGEDDVRKIKFIIGRMLFLSFLDKDSLFSESEEKTLLEEIKLYKSIKKQPEYYSLQDYKFKNKNMTVHNFVDDLGLKQLTQIHFPIDKDIIDVGAYVGDSALILSGYTARKVHAFEPFKDGFDELNINIELNDNKKIIPVNLGVSNKSGIDKLYFGDGAISISTNDTETALSKGAYTNVTEVENITLDSYVEKHQLDVGIIKIDAEGAEPKVLNGAKETILKQKPILLISIYHNIDDFIYIKPWVDDLNLNYKYKITKPEATTFIEETMLICYHD